MTLNNVLLLSQIAGYVITLILSLCILVPLILHNEEFKGHCLLFSTGEWRESDGQLDVKWASQGYCNYNIFLGVLSFIICVVQIYKLSILAYKGQDNSFLSAFVNVVISINLAGMTVIGAIMITLGFITWCQNMTQRFPSCEVAAGRDIDKQDKIDTAGFYIEIGVAQFGAWGSFACWVGLGVFALIKLCRHHQLENIRVSMYNERQRLVNETAYAGNSPINSLERIADKSDSANTSSAAPPILID